MSYQAIKEVLTKYIPEQSVNICSEWIIDKNIHLRITKGRSSKYGDYKPLPAGQGHKITINHDLNPYSFLITFIHEVAHLNCFKQFGNRHEPHGREWKKDFGNLLEKFIGNFIFPDEIEIVLKEYIKNPTASSCTDPDLHRILKKYNHDHDKDIEHLEELPNDSLFYIHQSKSGLIFKKGKKLRTRFHCLEVNSKREYLVNALAEVKRIANFNGSN